jgi:hypothetical protein
VYVAGGACGCGCVHGAGSQDSKPPDISSSSAPCMLVMLQPVLLRCVCGSWVAAQICTGL